MIGNMEESCSAGMFAIMWDNTGLEAVTRAPHEADRTWALLQNKPPPDMPNLNMWKLRARYNSQRHYEIYLITAVPGINEDDIRGMFNNNPQAAADTIRRIGQQVYSDRVDKNRTVIS